MCSLSVFGQNKSKDTTRVEGWFPNAVAGLNVSQLALSNWTQGGDNSITWTATLNGGLKYFSPEWKLDNNIKIAYGRTKLGGQDFRTNDNEFYLESVLSKKIDWVISPYFSNSIRTSVTTGYSYGGDVPKPIAGFFDPGYITQSLGFTYDKLASFKTRLGFALQEVFTNRYRQYTDDPKTEKIEAFKIETGIESVTSGEFNVAENLRVKSSLRLFSRFETLDVWDVRWDNSVIAKINSFMNVNIGFLLIYQKDQSPTVQMKQALQLGVVYRIL
jgi:hypothetical protein